ncbi:MAG: hypothetical protein ACNA7X_02410 [Dehalococcoidia bacterium]
MRLPWRLAIIVALCLMAVPSVAFPALAQNQALSLGLSPTQGVPGTEITVSYLTTGNFTPNTQVDILFAGVWKTTVTTDNDGKFTATILVPNTYRGGHPIRAEESTTIYAQSNFNVESGLTVTPEEGQVGDTVTVIGRGYGEDETGIQLYFGGQRVLVEVAIEADPDGFWTEDFTIPDSVSGTHRIDSVPAARHATFTVGPGIRLGRSSGSPGQSIAVTGGGFTANERNISILFAGEAVTAGIRSDDRGSWIEPFEVPEMPAGKYSVTAEGDRTLKADVGTIDFEVKPGIVLELDEGHVGMNVTAIGRGFAASSNVTVLYEDIDVTEDIEVVTDENGTFEFTFAVPESRHGAREVTGEDDEGNETEQPGIFTMEEDPPPTPQPVSPTDGDRVGFAAKVRPGFRWEEVFDLSGVYYSLQISTSANVTAQGFVDPVMTLEGLSGNYTLERNEALPHGTYYWIVQAVDGAENKSGWSEPESFRAGRLPLWAFIVIIVFIVLGAGGAGYYYAVRRRMYD